MTSDPNFMQSLARGLDVLAALSTLDPPWTVSRIAEKTGLARPVVRRCLHTLARQGFVAQTQYHYDVLPRVLLLSSAYFGGKSLPALAQPIMDKLRDEVGESSSLGVLEDQEVVYVARAAAARIISIALHVGTRLPAYCTSLGRVLLAELPDEERDHRLASMTLAARTPKTITNASRLRGELAAVAAQGYALVDQELELGLRSLAVPVRDRTGRMLAALNISASTARVSREKLEGRILPPLRHAAAAIGALVL